MKKLSAISLVFLFVTVFIHRALAQCGDGSSFGTNQWYGYVYDGTNFNTYIGQANEPAIFDENFGGDYVNYYPSCSYVYTETFSVRYKMRFNFSSGLYSFTIGADDGVRLYLDGTLIANDWSDHGYKTTSSGSYGLTGNHDLILEFYENGGGNRVSFNYNLIAPGNPSDFGDNVWNVYVWNAGDAGGGSGSWSSNYSGYYTIGNLSFDSRPGYTYSTPQSWDPNGTPSSASGYNGNPVNADNHSYSFKRRGFPCAKYQINVVSHDDRDQLFVNGSLVQDHNGWGDVHTNAWTGWLTSTSTVEFRVAEGGGGSNGALELVNVTPAIVNNMTVNGTAGNITVCNNNRTIAVAQSLGSTSDQTTYYYWGTDNGSGWSSWDLCANCNINVLSFNINLPGPGNYVVHTNAYNVCGTYGAGVTRLVQVQSDANNPGTISLSASTVNTCTPVTVNNVTSASTGTPASSAPTYNFYWQRTTPPVVGWTSYEVTANNYSTLPSVVTSTPGSYIIARNSKFSCPGTEISAPFVNLTVSDFSPSYTVSSAGTPSGVSVSAQNPSPTGWGRGGGGYFDYTAGTWPQCVNWGVATTMAAINGNDGGGCGSNNTLTFDPTNTYTDLANGKMCFTGSTQYSYLNTASGMSTSSLSVRMRVEITKLAGGAPLGLEKISNYLLLKAKENFRVRVYFETYCPAGVFGVSEGWYGAIDLYDNMHTPYSGSQICTAFISDFYNITGTGISPSASPNPACSGATINLTGSKGNLTTNCSLGYQWTGPNSFSSTSQNPSISNASTAASGTYYFSISSDKSCYGVGSTVVTVDQTPGAPGTPTISTVLCDRVNVNWTAGSSASGYEVQVSPNSSFSSFISGYDGNSNVGNVTGITVTGLSSNQTYWVRVRSTNGSSPCRSSWTTSTSATTQAGVPSTPAVGTAGNGYWYIYGFNAGDAGGGSNAWNNSYYQGYYTDATLNMNTEAKWSSGGSPSDASGFVGCYIGPDNHSWRAVRTGFPCGIYQIDINGHDDAAYLYVNGSQVWVHNPGCCDAHTNVWTGALSTSDVVEFKVSEGGGGSNGALSFIPISISTFVAGTISGIADNTAICSGIDPGNFGSSTAASGGTTGYNNGSAAYQWMVSTDGVNYSSLAPATMGGGSLPATQTYDPPAITNTGASSVTYYFRRIDNDKCSSANSNVIRVIVNPNPTVNVGGALSAICQGATSAAMGGSVGGGATGGTWSGGAGTWSNATNPSTATYTAGASESGSITLTLTTSGGSCGITSATKQIVVNPNPTVNVGGALSAICQGATSAAMGGSVGGGATGGTWSGGAGTWSNATNPSTATYTAGASESGSITLTLTTSGGSCGITSATKQIVVNPTPAAVTVTPATTTQCGGSVTLTAAGGSGGTIYWQGTNSGGTSTATPSSSQSVSSTGTYYFRSRSASGCWGAEGSASVTIHANPTVFNITGGGSYCGSGGVAVGLSGSQNGVGYQLYVDGIPGATANGTGSALSFGNQTTGGTYTAVATNGNTCSSNMNGSVTVTVNTLSTDPANVSVDHDNFCPGAYPNITLSFSGGSAGTGAVAKWYAGGCGSGASIGSGNNLVISAPSANTNYYVRYEGTCNTTNCAFKTVTVKTVSTAPTNLSPSTNNICANTNVNLNIIGGSLGTNAQWKLYSGSCGGALVSQGTGSSFTVSPNVSTHYYVRAEGDCGNTACADVIIYVTSSPSTAATSLSVSNASVCAGDPSTLTVNGGSLGLNAQWYLYSSAAPAACGSFVAGTQIDNNTTGVFTVNPTSDTYYYVRAENDCNATGCVSNSVTVNPAPTAPTGSNVSVCNTGFPATLTASAPSGSTVDWYDAATGGTLLQSNSSTYSAATAGSYYAESRNTTTNCVSATRTQITVSGETAITGLTVTTNSPLCINTTLNLGSNISAGSNVTYTWSGPGSFTANGQNVTRNMAAEDANYEGIYTVSAANTCGTVTESTASVNVHSPIPGSINVVYYSPYPGSPVNAVCEGSDLEIHAEAGSPFPNDITWSWTTGASSGFTSAVQNPVITNVSKSQDEGDYNVIATNACPTQGQGYGNIISIDQAPTTANADLNGLAAALPDNQVIEVCGTTGVTLQANNPAIGTGAWSQIAGPGTSTFSPANGQPGNNNNNVTISGYSAPSPVTYRWTISNGVCPPSESDVRVLFDPKITVSTILAGCSFVPLPPFSNDSIMILVTGSGGTGTLTYSHPNSDELRIDVSGSNKVYTAPTDGNAHNYTVSDAFCSESGSVTTPATKITDIPLASAPSGTTTANCYDKNFNKWLTFRDNNNDAILAINDNDQDLGEVNVTVYKDNTEPSILTTVGSTCQNYPNTAMRRHFVVTAANSFAAPVSVRLYFSEAELQSLKTASLANDIANDACSKNDNVNTVNDLYVTKYTGSNEDGDYSNNDANGIYRVFGSSSVGPQQPDGPLARGAFSALYDGGQSHHYVEMDVTEFSEMWLHGSQNGSPLPVEMLYIEANAIDNSYIEVKWATALEINNSGFQVERSTDGQNWATIGWVDGHNNSTTQQDYRYSDYSVAANVRYYYRLKQVDNDGEYEYTGIVSAIINSQMTFSVKDFIPNPAGNITRLIITATSEQTIGVDIYNAIGQKVISETHQLNKGGNELPFDLTNIAAGSYTAVVSSANEVYSKKLIVVK